MVTRRSLHFHPVEDEVGARLAEPLGAQPEGVGAPSSVWGNVGRPSTGPVDECDLDEILDDWGGGHGRGNQGSRP